jgi:hypothetical protein
MDTSDPAILSHIGDLVEQEKELRRRSPDAPLAEEEQRRLEQIETELDQCWDLLNRRRALRESGMEPDRADVRDEETVEDYLQ